jgi:hypothetical protein
VAVIVAGRLWATDGFTPPGANATLPPARVQPPPATVFAGTPAAHFANGADGIVLPAALTSGPFPETRVAADLAIVKQALVASRLDPIVLTGHDPSDFITLLAPDDRTAVQKDLDAHHALAYLTEIAPGSTLTTDPIKVSGTVAVGNRTTNGVPELTIQTNFVWVYPFTGERATAGDHLVVVRSSMTWGFALDTAVAKSSRGLWVDAADAYASNVDCTAFASDEIALGSPKPLAGPTRNAAAPFDPKTSIDTLPQDC